MTVRLYYNDPYKRAFDASIAAVVDHEGRPAILLDQTAFYPASGGQPFDTGTLTAVVTYTFDGSAATGATGVVDQDKTATLPESTVTISQS